MELLGNFFHVEVRVHLENGNSGMEWHPTDIIFTTDHHVLSNMHCTFIHGRQKAWVQEPSSVHCSWPLTITAADLHGKFVLSVPRCLALSIQRPWFPEEEGLLRKNTRSVLWNFKDIRRKKGLLDFYWESGRERNHQVKADSTWLCGLQSGSPPCFRLMSLHPLVCMFWGEGECPCSAMCVWTTKSIIRYLPLSLSNIFWRHDLLLNLELTISARLAG